MKTGKEIIYEYCKEKSKIDISHLENCQYNLDCFESEKLIDLCGCPASYGLEDFVGDCELEPEVNKGWETCNECWERALKVVQ